MTRQKAEGRRQKAEGSGQRICLLPTVCCLLLLALAVLLAGCTSQPRAPILRDDPVYQNDREGFRFLVPSGWLQQARGEAPPGRAEQERTLVEYKRPLSGPALLAVTLIDLPPTADLAAFLARRSYGVEKWQPVSAPEAVEAGGLPAVRHTFTGQPGKVKLTREVIAVRRGERVYLFTAMYASSDVKTRDEARGGLASLIWK